MKKSIISALALSALVAGCSNDKSTTAAEDAAPMVPDNATPSTQESAAMSATDFATNLAASDMFEIESSKLALQKAQSAEVKKFAQSMIDAHTQSSAKLKAIAAAAKPPIMLPTMLPADKNIRIDSLSKASGASFDAMYMTHQTEAHQNALSMLEGYAANGQDAALKQLAASLAPIVSGHLDMVRRMKMPETAAE